jgi:hypothetical protein
MSIQILAIGGRNKYVDAFASCHDLNSFIYYSTAGQETTLMHNVG